MAPLHSENQEQHEELWDSKNPHGRLLGGRRDASDAKSRQQTSPQIQDNGLKKSSRRTARTPTYSTTSAWEE